MTINNTSKGNIAPPGATSYMAILKFYAWADKNHMPIREVVVDWGDDSFPFGRDSGIKGKNRRATCDSRPPERGGDSWGGSADACTQGYFQFVNTYICQAGGAGYDKNTNKCSFTPKVYVKDNWGWCNDGNYVGDISCWTDGHGQPYDGQIILSPASD